MYCRDTNVIDSDWLVRFNVMLKMCLKKKRLEDIYTCTHMNGSLLSVHTSEQIGVHVSISIIVLQNVHFVIFFPSIFLHRKGIHTTPGKAAHPCNHASLLFA